MKLELPRGMRDIESKESSSIEYVRKKFIETSNLFGFQFMEPTTIELVSVIETKSGPAIKNEIYYFTDKGDREVALRFDFTIGLTRYATSQKSMRLPAKFSTFGGVWRYDEPQKGRYRFFHQWDIEIYGEPTVESDAEIIDFTSKFFSNLGLKNMVIDICDRGLVESTIKRIFNSDSSEAISDILRAVDKVQKKRKQDIVKEYQEKGYSIDALEQILEFAQLKGSPDEIQKQIDVSKLENWDKMTKLFEVLHNRGVHNIRINFGIVRGLDYYSGVVFEVFENNFDVGALVGGGRYDTLTKAFGREDLGATGAAGGVERIVLLLEKQQIQTTNNSGRISVVFVNDEMKKFAISIASQLRQNSIPTDVDLSGKSLKKQMEMATESKYAVIVAPKEYSDQLVIIRNMKDGSEKLVKVDTLINFIQSNL